MATLLFDFDNLAVRTLHGSKEVLAESSEPNYEYWKYVTFNSIYWMLFKERIHEVILAPDSQSWRKIVYPLYKADRVKKREDSKVDWERFKEVKNEFLGEIKEFLPFKIIDINKAEGDDIIGALINSGLIKDGIIVSMDCDYQQLSNKCRIYNPIMKKFVSTANTERFLVEASLTGQKKKDNIFNVLTPHDWPEWKKRPPLGEKGIDRLFSTGTLDEFLDTKVKYEFNNGEEKGTENYEEFISELVPRDMYNLNRKLIDFQYTPKVMVDKIVEKYTNYKISADPERFYEFFKRKSWNEVLEKFTTVEYKLMELY